MSKTDGWSWYGFNTYRFAGYKEQVIDLLLRVCTVSVETMKIIREIP